MSVQVMLEIIIPTKLVTKDLHHTLYTQNEGVSCMDVSQVARAGVNICPKTTKRFPNGQIKN